MDYMDDNLIPTPINTKGKLFERGKHIAKRVYTRFPIKLQPSGVFIYSCQNIVIYVSSFLEIIYKVAMECLLGKK